MHILVFPIQFRGVDLQDLFQNIRKEVVLVIKLPLATLRVFPTEDEIGFQSRSVRVAIAEDICPFTEAHLKDEGMALTV